MHTRSKALLAALSAALVLAAAVNTASANRLSQSEQRFKQTYSPLNFVTSISRTLRCPVTLEGSFHSRTIVKTEGLLLGYVNRASMGVCESGRLRFNTETLPWHVQYAGFEGTLPNITGLREHLIRMSFEVAGESFGLTGRCRYTAASELFIDNREESGNIRTERPGTESTSSEINGCPSLRLEGDGNVGTPAGGAIAVRLI